MKRKKKSKKQLTHYRGKRFPRRSSHQRLKNSRNVPRKKYRNKFRKRSSKSSRKTVHKRHIHLKRYKQRKLSAPHFLKNYHKGYQQGIVTGRAEGFEQGWLEAYVAHQ